MQAVLLHFYLYIINHLLDSFRCAAERNEDYNYLL